MAEKSLFWDADLLEDGSFDRVYNSDDFASIFQGFWTDGIIANRANPLKVSIIENTMGVTVEPGDAVVWGRFYSNTEQITFPLELGQLEDRTDLIVLRTDRLARKMEIKLLKGLEGAGEPIYANNEYVRDLVLAKIAIPAKTVILPQGALEDCRGKELAPWCNVTFNLDALTNRFEDWFNGIREKLEGDVAGNLANAIDELEQKHDAEVEQLKSDLAALESKHGEDIKEVKLNAGAVWKDEKIYIRTRPYDPNVDTDIP